MISFIILKTKINLDSRQWTLKVNKMKTTWIKDKWDLPQEFKITFGKVFKKLFGFEGLSERFLERPKTV